MLSRVPRRFPALLLGLHLCAGMLVFTGCGDEKAAPDGKPGAAPVDNDDAARQKAMQDYMEQEAKKKK
mgnify:CR=1 FL=1